MSGSMPCIWMSAGLVAYKLCDREYACEGCPFDAAMRGSELRPSKVAEPLDPPFPGDRRYHSGHLWVRRVGRERVRVGIDAFAGRLLSAVDGVILPPPGTPVRRDAALCWVHDGTEVVPLRSPVTGRITVTHGLVRHRPTLLHEDPYGDGWLFEVRTRPRTASDGDLLDADAARDVSRDQQRELDREVRAFAVAPSIGEAGPTLQDGGVPFGDPRTILGPRRYYRTISAYLV
jgi:glycine cleavage system H protein